MVGKLDSEVFVILVLQNYGFPMMGLSDSLDNPKGNSKHLH